MAKWVDEHPGTDTYSFSKMAINVYAASGWVPPVAARGAIERGDARADRHAARCANADIWLGFGADYRAKAGVDVLSAQQVADVIVFLCSPAASAVNGVTLLVDSGHVGAAITGSYDDPIIRMLAGVL